MNEELVAKLVEFLENNNDPPSDPDHESRAAELARQWSYRLLAAADADGRGGCPLCQE